MKFFSFFTFFVIISILNSACFSGSSARKVFFPEIPDEINTTNSLKSFLTKNKAPKVVLRVSNSKNKVTENENVDALYAVIEKELMSNGFEVRDRQLFNQIIDSKENTSNYEDLNKATDTDLIIELMEMNTKIPYFTNKYIDGSTSEEKTMTFKHTEYGRSIEFKVIIIKSNQFAGSYKFNFTPCVNGCIIQAAIPSSKEFKEMRKNQKAEVKNPVGYSGVYNKRENEEFVRVSTQKLIHAMRDN